MPVAGRRSVALSEATYYALRELAMINLFIDVYGELVGDDYVLLHKVHLYNYKDGDRTDLVNVALPYYATYFSARQGLTYDPSLVGLFMKHQHMATANHMPGLAAITHPAVDTMNPLGRAVLAINDIYGWAVRTDEIDNALKRLRQTHPELGERLSRGFLSPLNQLPYNADIVLKPTWIPTWLPARVISQLEAGIKVTDNPQTLHQALYSTQYLTTQWFTLYSKLPKYVDSYPYAIGQYALKTTCKDPLRCPPLDMLKVMLNTSLPLAKVPQSMLDPFIVYEAYQHLKNMRQLVMDLMELVYEFDSDPDVLVHLYTYLFSKYEKIRQKLDKLRSEAKHKVKLFNEFILRFLHVLNDYMSGMDGAAAIVNADSVDALRKIRNGTYLLTTFGTQLRFKYMNEEDDKERSGADELSNDIKKARLNRKLVSKFMWLAVRNMIGAPIFRASLSVMRTEYQAILDMIYLAEMPLERLKPEVRALLIRLAQDAMDYFMTEPNSPTRTLHYPKVKRLVELLGMTTFTRDDAYKVLKAMKELGIATSKNDVDLLNALMDENTGWKAVVNHMRRFVRRKVYISVDEETYQRLMRIKQYYRAKSMDDAVTALFNDLYSVYTEANIPMYTDLMTRLRLTMATIQQTLHNSNTPLPRAATASVLTAVRYAVPGIFSDPYMEFYRMLTNAFLAYRWEIYLINHRKDLIELLGPPQPRPPLTFVVGRSKRQDAGYASIRDFILNDMMDVEVTDEASDPAILPSKVVVPKAFAIGFNDWLNEADKFYKKLSLMAFFGYGRFFNVALPGKENIEKWLNDNFLRFANKLDQQTRQTVVERLREAINTIAREVFGNEQEAQQLYAEVARKGILTTGKSLFIDSKLNLQNSMPYIRWMSRVYRWILTKARELARELLLVNPRTVIDTAFELYDSAVKAGIVNDSDKTAKQEAIKAAIAITLSRVYAKLAGIPLILAKFNDERTFGYDMTATTAPFMSPLYYASWINDYDAILTPLLNFETFNTAEPILWVRTPPLPGIVVVLYLAWLLEAAWVGFLAKIQPYLEELVFDKQNITEYRVYSNSVIDGVVPEAALPLAKNYVTQYVEDPEIGVKHTYTDYPPELFAASIMNNPSVGTLWRAQREVLSAMYGLTVPPTPPFTPLPMDEVLAPVIFFYNTAYPDARLMPGHYASAYFVLFIKYLDPLMIYNAMPMGGSSMVVLHKMLHLLTKQIMQRQDRKGFVSHFLKSLTTKRSGGLWQLYPAYNMSDVFRMFIQELEALDRCNDIKCMEQNEATWWHLDPFDINTAGIWAVSPDLRPTNIGKEPYYIPEYSHEAIMILYNMAPFKIATKKELLALSGFEPSTGEFANPSKSLIENKHIPDSWLAMPGDTTGRYKVMNPSYRFGERVNLPPPTLKAVARDMLSDTAMAKLLTYTYGSTWAYIDWAYPIYAYLYHMHYDLYMCNDLFIPSEPLTPICGFQVVEHMPFVGILDKESVSSREEFLSAFTYIVYMVRNIYLMRFIDKVDPQELNNYLASVARVLTYPQRLSSEYSKYTSMISLNKAMREIVAGHRTSVSVRRQLLGMALSQIISNKGNLSNLDAGAVKAIVEVASKYSKPMPVVPSESSITVYLNDISDRTIDTAYESGLLTEMVKLGLADDKWVRSTIENYCESLADTFGRLMVNEKKEIDESIKASGVGKVCMEFNIDIYTQTEKKYKEHMEQLNTLEKALKEFRDRQIMERDDVSQGEDEGIIFG